MASYPDFDELIQSSENQNTPLILLMGPPRSGKTSILRVLFGKLSPHDTSFLEPTTTPCGIVYPQQTATSQKEALLKCRIIDLPGSSTFHRQHHALITKLLSVAACVVFVIGASADSTWSDATSSLLSLLGTMESLDVQRHVAVLLHKIDGEAFNEVSPQYTELRRGLLDSLRSASIKLPVTFYVTSLFDVTIFESFSRIFQQIIPQTNLLGTLLDGFISACGIEKVFIVDTNSKLYIASDSTLPDVTLYQLLGDMLDLVFDIGFVYSPNQDYEEDDQQKIGQSQPATLQDAALAMNELNQFGAQSLIQPQDNPTKPQNSNTNNNNDNNNNNNNNNNNHNNDRKEKDDFDSCNAEITLHNGVHLSLRQLNSHISLLFSLRPGEGLGGAGGNIGNGTPPTNSKGVVEYNITCLKQAISQLFNLNIHGIQPRPSLITTLTQSGINPADYGVHHYMGSYASQSAIANLKSSYYSNLIGASLPAKSYMVGGQSLIGPSSMALNSSRAVPASISNGFGAVPEHSGINTPGGSLPNQRGR